MDCIDAINESTNENTPIIPKKRSRDCSDKLGYWGCCFCLAFSLSTCSTCCDSPSECCAATCLSPCVACCWILTLPLTCMACFCFCPDFVDEATESSIKAQRNVYRPPSLPYFPTPTPTPTSRGYPEDALTIKHANCTWGACKPGPPHECPKGP